MKRTTRSMLIYLVVIGFFSSGFVGVAIARKLGTCGPPPPAKPHYRKAAEGFPPLPLPVVPLRRTEKKRPPKPPKLIGKLEYGDTQDWNTDPGDVDNLLRKAKGQMGISYRRESINVGKIVRRYAAGIDEKTPILYISGHDAFSFTKEQREALRKYVVGGGFLVGDACCGAPEFAASFRAEMANMFPKRPLKLLPLDHPIYSSFYKINAVDYLGSIESPLDMNPTASRADRYTDVPKLKGINIGCRTSVVFSEFDLSCGWDGHTHPHGARVVPKDAVRLGLNMIAYALATRRLGKFLAVTHTIEGPNVRPREQFVLAQIRHQGDWDPTYNGTANLLKEIVSNTSGYVRFERKDINLIDPDLFNYPFLYLTGHFDPKFTNEEIKRLRTYLTSGGFLLAESCCGRKEFDANFRAIMKKVFPELGLEELDREHPVFSAFYDVNSLHYNMSEGEYAPSLEGLSADGHLVVVYSRYGLGAGWQKMHCPYSKCIASDDSLKLTTNIIVYAMQN